MNGKGLAAGAWVFPAYRARLLRYLAYLGCPREDAEDVVQDVFLAVAERDLPAGEIERSAYVRTIARNLLAKRRRTREIPVADAAELEEAWRRFEKDDGGDGYREALRGCLAQVSERARTLLSLRYAQNASREQIARELGLDPEGAKTMLRRLKESLHACVQRKVHHDAE